MVRAAQRSADGRERAEEFWPGRWMDEGSAGRVRAGMFAPFGVGQLNCARQFDVDYEGTVVVAEIWRRFRVKLARRTR